MEILDLFDSKKNKLGKTFIRDSGETKQGEYRISLHIWIINDKDEILIQQRSYNKQRNPGKWAFTGGLPFAGESSLDGGIREVKEELGINLEKEDMELLITFRREHDFVDVWVVKNNAEIEDLTIQKEEVEKVKWVSIEEMEKMIKAGVCVPAISLYFDLLKKLMYKCYFRKEEND